MDDGEIEFTDHDMFAESHLVNDIPCAASMESFLDELLKNTHSCTHTHKCNPPGPDNTHTHTCFHTHTQLFATPEEEKSVDKSENPSPSSGRKRSVGNREAVKKYREKKKAHTAFLEEQVDQLRLLNQQLARRLQGQAALEAEVLRLRALLSEFRGRIDAELGLSVQKYCPRPDIEIAKGDDVLLPISGGCCPNTISVPCDDDVPCLHPSLRRQKDIGHRETMTSCGAREVVDASNCKGKQSDNSSTRRGRKTKSKDTALWCAHGQSSI